MRHRNFVKQYLSSLFDSQLMPTAFKVAIFIGSLLFTINHGWALLNSQMTSERWISGGLTYIVPYLVSIHGQYIGRREFMAKKGR